MIRALKWLPILIGAILVGAAAVLSHVILKHERSRDHH